MCLIIVKIVLCHSPIPLKLLLYLQKKHSYSLYRILNQPFRQINEIKQKKGSATRVFAYANLFIG
jgi:hypothetical protein